MRLSPLRRSVFVLAAALASLAPGVARADAGSKAAAESLFQDARKLMDEKRYAEACGKFEESQRLDPKLGTMLNLARCHELEGKTATAWAEYLEVKRGAASAGQAQRAATASELADALEKRLSKLTIVAPSPTPGAVIERDGVAVGSGALSTPVAVDPGPHTVTVSAPGHEAWSTTVTIAEGPSEQTITVPALQKARADKPDKQDPPRDAGTLRVSCFVIGGVGVAALGVGAVFGVMTLNDAANAASDPKLCPDKRCSPAGRAAIQAAETKALVSTIGVAAGLAALGAGVTLVAISPPKERAKETTSAVVRVEIMSAPGGLGVGASGRF